MSKIAVVTGASGCVGGAVSRALVAGGWSVRHLTRTPGPGHVGDLGDPASLRGLCSGADLVVHAGANLSDWRAGQEIWRVNRDGTLALLDEAARAGVSRFVYVSTVDVFGFRIRGTIDEDSPRLCPPYAYSLSKLAGEEAALAADLPVTVIYPTWVFGPGDRHLMPELTKALRAGAMTNIDRGRAHLELTYSENLASAIVLAAAHPPGRYIVGDSYGVTFGDFLSLVATRLGVPAPRRSVPYPVAFTAAAMAELGATLLRRAERPTLTRYAVGSAAGGMRYDLSAIRGLGYTPRVDLDTALDRALGLAPSTSAG
ncbi:NAD(P)-dependent oxidoreductase [Actinophytocola sp.]|uniref:NAD-dependent epimerase/dehydratase family protein n=1 Tax=Actinophytocola sp. TaxID=1872138 RepID=UPI0025BB3D5F|nr:NAD-dependent epimerase/dehydratase family protein [Actinophytocola sp.]